MSGVARPAGGGRERDRRIGQHRRRPRRACGTRRLHALSTAAFATHVVSAATMTLPYDVIGDFEPVALISATPWLIAAKKDLPANDLQEPHRLVEGQSGQGVARHRGRRQPVAHRRRACSRTSPVRASSSCPIAAPRRPRRTWSRARSTCRSSIRSPACRRCAPARIKVLAVMAKSRTANAPDSPDRGRGRRARPAHGAMAGDLDAEGHAEGRYRQAQRRGGRRRWPIRRFAPSSRSRATRSAPREEQTPEYLGAFHKAEIEKWWPIIKAAGIKGG